MNQQVTKYVVDKTQVVVLNVHFSHTDDHHLNGCHKSHKGHRSKGYTLPVGGIPGYHGRPFSWVMVVVFIHLSQVINNIQTCYIVKYIYMATALE